MKKILILVLSAVMIVSVFAACADNNAGSADRQQIKAIIEQVNESSLLVQPLEGLDGIDIVYLNMREETKVNVSQGAPIEPGTIVYAVIGTEIMESYPPQVVLYEITKTEIDPSITLTPMMDDIELAADNYVTGKVMSISGSEYTIEVLGANLFEGEITVIIPSEVLKADMPIEIGYLIGVNVDLNSDPLTATSLVYSEPDQIIELDDRETISGYLGGEFPQAVYYMTDQKFDAEAGVMFAIGLEENCESTWTLTEQSGVEVVASGTSQADEDGMCINYFGIKISEPGDYTLVFINETPDGTFDYSFDVTVTK